jgi:hypothetical protein
MDKHPRKSQADPTELTDPEIRELLHMHLKTLIARVEHASQDELTRLLTRCTVLAWQIKLRAIKP